MKIVYFVLAVIAALIVGFFFLNNYIYYEKQGGAPVTETEETETTAPTLTGKTWMWEESLYNDERIITPRNADAFTLSFSEDGNFSVTTDCNAGFGTYTRDGTQLMFGPIGLTKKFCEGAQEQEFVQMLEHTSGYHFSPDGQLILDLKFDSGSVVLR